LSRTTSSSQEWTPLASSLFSSTSHSSSNGQSTPDSFREWFLERG
jgi:hypothetical protein